MEEDKDLNNNYGSKEEPKLVDDQLKDEKLITEEKDTELINNLTEQIEAMQDKLLRAVA